MFLVIYKDSVNSPITTTSPNFRFNSKSLKTNLMIHHDQFSKSHCLIHLCLLYKYKINHTQFYYISPSTLNFRHILPEKCI